MKKPTTNFNTIEYLQKQNLIYHVFEKCMEIKLFDHFEQTPISAKQYAEQMGFIPSYTDALLELLTSSNLLEKIDGNYKNSKAVSEHLTSSSPFKQDLSIPLHSSFNQTVYTNLIETLKGEETKSKTDRKWGMEDAMEGTAQYASKGDIQDFTEIISNLPDFKKIHSMCDIGGNHGEYSIAILDKNPDLSGVIADLPQVAETSNKRIEKRGYSNRLKAFGCVLGEEELPTSSYDLVIASHILYGFIDRFQATLRTIYNSLNEGGWFATHHLNRHSDIPADQIQAVNFVTVLGGYKTHFLSEEFLTEELLKAGFKNISTYFRGFDNKNIIVVAQK